MPVAVHPDLHLLDIGIDLALLVGQLFIHGFEPREYLAVLAG